MKISTEQVKELRDETGISVMQVRKALEEAQGDKAKALVILKKKGGDAASKKADRTLGAGIIQSYIHSTGTVGAMVELSCETDFVSGNQEFKTLAYEIAMQVAATNPDFVSKEDITPEAKKTAEEVFAKEVVDKPKEMQAKILEGKVSSYFKDKVLLEQAFIKDQDVTISALLEKAVQKFGEKIVIGRFVRFSALNK
jgi:elongation factor Ts